MDFKGKIIIITGASSGIGKETAICFSKHYAKLCLVGRNLEHLEKTAEICRKECLTAKDVIIVQVDLVEKGSTKMVVDETISKFGGIDILINNAGILKIGSLQESSMEQFDLIMNTNIRAVFELTKLAVPHLMSSHGNIVNVSSLNAIRSVGYIATDSPGYVETNITRYTGLSEEHLQKYAAHSKTTHPIGRIGQASEVAAVILFLASDQASNVTGVMMPCDGGRQNTCAM